MKIYKEAGEKSLRVAGRIDFDVGVQNSRLVDSYLSPTRLTCRKELVGCECTAHKHYHHQHCPCSCHGGHLRPRTAAELFSCNRSYLTKHNTYEPRSFEREDRQERSLRSYFIPTGFKLNPSDTSTNHYARTYQFTASKTFRSVDEELAKVQNRKDSASYHSREYAAPYKPCGEFSAKSSEAQTTGLFGSKFSIQPREETSFGHFKNKVLSTSYSKSSTSKIAKDPTVYSDAFKSPAYRKKQDLQSNPSPETRRLMMNKLIQEMEGRLAKEKAEEQRNLREKQEQEELLDLKKRAKASALDSELKAREKSAQRKQREAEARAATAALERDRQSKLRSSREKPSSAVAPQDSSLPKQLSQADRERFERIEAEIERLKKKNQCTTSSLRSREKPALANSLDIDQASAGPQNEEATSRKERQTSDVEKLKQQLQNSLTKKNLDEDSGKHKPRKLSSKLNAEEARHTLPPALARPAVSTKSRAAQTEDVRDARVLTEGTEGKDTLRRQDFPGKALPKQDTFDSLDQPEDSKRKIPLVFDSKKKPQKRDPGSPVQTHDKAAQVNTIFAGAEETLPSSDDRNKLWVKPAIRGEAAVMPGPKKSAAVLGRMQVPSIEVQGLQQQQQPQPPTSSEVYFKMSSRDEDAGKHHGFSKRQTANFLQLSDHDAHRSRSPGKELGKVYSENEFQGDCGRDSEAGPEAPDGPDGPDPAFRFGHPREADGRQPRQPAGASDRPKQYQSSPTEPRPPHPQSSGVKSAASKKQPHDALLTESEPEEEGDYINRNLSQEEDPHQPSDAARPFEASSASKPPRPDPRRDAQKKKEPEADPADSRTQQSGTDKKPAPPAKQPSPLPSPKSKVDTAGLSQKSSQQPHPPRSSPLADAHQFSTASQLGRPEPPAPKQLSRNKTDSQLLGSALAESKLVHTDKPQTEDKSSQNPRRPPRLDDSSNADAGSQEEPPAQTPSARSDRRSAQAAQKRPDQHIFTAENVNREDFDDFASAEEKDIRDEIPQDFKPRATRPVPRADAPRKRSASRSPRGIVQNSILLEERKSATNRELPQPKSKLELSNIIKKSSHRFSVGPESVRQSALPALVEPLPEPVDKRDFFVDKPQAGGFTISKLPRFDNRPALNIDAIKHIKRFPGTTSSDKVQNSQLG